MSKKQKNKRTSVLSIRLPTTIIEELDHLVATLTVEQPGINVTRADAARIFLLRGINASNIKN